MATLLVIGAGAKGVALGAKCSALQSIGLNPPDLVLLEREGIATNWLGHHGFTDGSPELGTPPEKDVGFPYQSIEWGDRNREVDRAMRKYSWQEFLIGQTEKPGPYWKWVDRGRPQPTHSEWGRYLIWVSEATDPNIKIGTPTSIAIGEGKWTVTYQPGNIDTAVAYIHADGLVITGPGLPGSSSPFVDVQGHDHFYDAITFWKQLDDFNGLAPHSVVSVVGGGETAASIVAALLDRLEARSTIQLVVPKGTILSRGENFSENRLYSDPSEWERLSPEHKRDFISRTDKGVFSQQAQNKINKAENVQIIAGRVEHARRDGQQISVNVKYESGPVNKWQCDRLIDASHVDPLWFTKILDTSAKNALVDIVGQLTVGNFEKLVDRSLAVKDLSPKLHIPMLSAFGQGPGFPNLSSLGLLSDRILRAYTPE